MQNNSFLKLIWLLALIVATTVPTLAQSKRVTGIVNDNNNEPIIGANVLVKGTNTGVITDLDGKFSIEVPTNTTTLTVSYIGFLSQDVDVTSASSVTGLHVTLQEDLQNLDEVVVVGYGTMRKRDLTGALASVGESQLKERSYSNALQTMAGQMAGVQIQQVSGAPGSAPAVKIRGSSSLTAGTNPLYVVDGVPLEDPSKSEADGTNDGDDIGAFRNPMSFINPNDIESIEVLKDAASAAIYGSRGANGVVLITTKQGKAGKTKINASYEYGVSSVQRKVQMMDAKEWFAYETAARTNSGQAVPALYTDPYWINKIGNGTDWQDVMFRTGITNNTQLSASGGSENTQFMVSGNYLSSTGVVDASDYERFSLRSNLRHQLSKTVKIGVNASMARSSSDDVGTGGKGDVVSLALQNNPVFPVYTETGSYGPHDPNSEWNTWVKEGTQAAASFWHPYAMTREQTRSKITYNVLATTFLEWNILKELIFKTSLSANYNGIRYHSFWNSVRNYGWSGGANDGNEAKYKTNQTYGWVNENTLNYIKSFGDHSVTALAGYTVQESKYEDSYIRANQFPNNAVHTINAGVVQEGTSTASEWALISYLARATYGYQGKYLASASIRADGSSRFGINNRWGYFPSASAGWRVSEEKFLQEADWISNLKLRASYGVTGNNQVGDYSAVRLLSNASYPLGGSVIQGMYTNNYPDENLKWERTSQMNIGLDIAFISRINLTLDYYVSTTNDLLLSVPIPVISGFAETLTNIGKLQNKGLEFTLSTHNVKTKHFNWTTDFNISGNRSKVLALGLNDAPVTAYNYWDTQVRFEVGQPAYFYGYKIDGVIMNNAELTQYPVWAGSEAGDPKVVDVNGDGKISEDDRTNIGSAQPDFVWAFTNNLSFKDFDLSFMLTGSQGNEIFNQNSRYLKRYNGARGVYKEVANYWQSEANPGNGQIPKPRASANTVQNLGTSYWVEDGSFVRIKNIRLGYNLPNKLNKNLHIEGLKLYVNMENIYVFSDYNGYDPESSTETTGNMVGLDFGSYPTPLVCTFGVNLSF